MDFTQKKRCMEAGIEAAKKAMPEIKKRLEAFNKPVSAGATPISGTAN
jgi:hypothetical protein